MSIYDYFKRQQQDLTQDWQMDSSIRNNLILDEASLNGVDVGDPLDKLQWLGPAEELRDREGFKTYCYFTKGLQVIEIAGRADHFIFEFYQGPMGDKTFDPFDGQISFQGKPLPPWSTITSVNLVEHIGEPLEKESYHEKVSMHYFFSRSPVCFDFVRNEANRETLCEIEIT